MLKSSLSTFLRVFPPGTNSPRRPLQAIKGFVNCQEIELFHPVLVGTPGLQSQTFANHIIARLWQEICLKKLPVARIANNMWGIDLAPGASALPLRAFRRRSAFDQRVLSAFRSSLVCASASASHIKTSIHNITYLTQLFTTHAQCLQDLQIDLTMPFHETLGEMRMAWSNSDSVFTVLKSFHLSLCWYHMDFYNVQEEHEVTHGDIEDQAETKAMFDNLQEDLAAMWTEIDDKWF
jgi:hypothetical protein